MTVTATQTQRGSTWVAGVGVLAAVAAGTVVWALARLLDVDLTVSFGAQPIPVTVVSVVVTALLASLAGWGLLALLRRFTARALVIWTAASTVAAAASLLGPLTATAPATTKLALVTMHLAVATVLIGTLRRTVRR